MNHREDERPASTLMNRRCAGMKKWAFNAMKTRSVLTSYFMYTCTSSYVLHSVLCCCARKQQNKRGNFFLFLAFPFNFTIVRPPRMSAWTKSIRNLKHNQMFWNVWRFCTRISRAQQHIPTASKSHMVQCTSRASVVIMIQVLDILTVNTALS